MVMDAYLRDWRKVTPECMVWGRDFDLAERGLMNIPERITCMFFDKPGPGLRTDDEAGWQKAISEGVTVLRTAKPRELRQYIAKLTPGAVGAGPSAAAANPKASRFTK